MKTYSIFRSIAATWTAAAKAAQAYAAAPERRAIRDQRNHGDNNAVAKSHATNAKGTKCLGRNAATPNFKGKSTQKPFEK